MSKNILIVGPARSGTTLIQQIITTDDNFFSPKETHFFSLLNPLNPLLKLLPINFFYYRAYKNLNKILNNKKKMLLKNLFLSKKNFYKIFFDILDSKCVKENKKSWCEKTPRHLFFIDELLNHSFNFNCIVIVRNPSETLNSQIKAIKKNRHSWLGLFKRFTTNNLAQRLHDNYLEVINISRYTNVFVIKYEELVSKPNVIISKLNRKFNLKCTSDISKSNNQLFDVKIEPWKKNNLRTQIVNDISSSSIKHCDAKLIEQYNLDILYESIN